MRHRQLIAFLLPVALLGSACSGSTGDSHAQEARGEHDRESGEHGGEGGEESGAQFAKDENYDATRNGVRLMLAYDEGENAFHGTVENTTGESLERVRVEVHLSNGKELGPTPPGDLEPGETRDVTLTATTTDFERWSAHPEVGSSEHGPGGDGEHGHEGEGEHR